MAIFIPSMASANQLNLQKSLDSLGKIKRIHFDIEDGNFIDNITFGLRTVRDVLNYTDRQADAHLMVTNPGQYIDDLLALGVKSIAVHVESGIFPAAHLHRIRQQGGRAGLALNFMAPLSTLPPYIKDVDYVLLMTSEPDGRGQQFNPGHWKKLLRPEPFCRKRFPLWWTEALPSSGCPKWCLPGRIPLF